ncbi:MAG: proton-conducting transporter membrane subunit [Acidimicrobiales bacterium]
MSAHLFLVAAIAWAAAALAGLSGNRRVFLWLSGLTSSLGGVACLAGGIMIAVDGHGTATANLSPNVPVGGLVLRATPLAAPFLVLLGLVVVAIGLYAPRYHHLERGTTAYLCAFNLATIACLAVLVAGNVTTFLVAWESMTLTTALLVLRYRQRAGVGEAGYLYLALGEVGFAMVVAAFVILATQAHSLDFAVVAGRSGSIGLGWRSAAFVLALLGFGFKAGIVPLHVWLPAAHPVAPADGSAFLSGMVLKLGVFGVMLFAFVLLGPGPAWWGILTMGLGALSAIIGILYAVVERDLKRFLAYSSIENIGIINTAVGASMVFTTYRQPALGGLLLLIALYHVVNHGAYKTLLFLEAGVVEHATGTRDLDKLGGLVHTLRRSAVISLVGTMGIAALPPLNGFVSEWLIFQGLFQGFRVDNNLISVLILLAAATLGLTAGLAVLAFARAFGVGFLGMPRSAEAAAASESGQPVLGPALLAVACVALAIGAPAVLLGLDRVVRNVTGVQLRPILLPGNLTVIPAHTDFAAFSPTYLAVFLVAVTVVPLAIYLAGRPRGSTRKVPVWDGGIVSYKARMQYTATTFSNPVKVTFERLYQPEVHIDRASDDPAGRSGPVHYRAQVTPLFEKYLYAPAVRAIRAVAGFLRPIQSGDVNLYLLYILVVVVVAYFVYRW